MKVGDLVKRKYARDFVCGVITSHIEYHTKNNYVWKYIWVLWSSGEHTQTRIDYLEVINGRED